MGMSAGVAELPDSTSCLPKYSGGRELPARYRELRGAEGTEQPWQELGNSTVLVPPLWCARHWCSARMQERHLDHPQPSELASCGLAPARTVLGH